MYVSAALKQHYVTFSARNAVTPATLKRAATSFAAWWTEAQWVWTVCLTLLPDRGATAIWTRALPHPSPACWPLGYRATPDTTIKIMSAAACRYKKTAGLAESYGSLPPGLWFTLTAGWLPRTRISSGTLCSVIKYGLAFFMLHLTASKFWPHKCKNSVCSRNDNTYHWNAREHRLTLPIEC